jgi:endonuclease/exonuclease/phosphatase family metal-dependent hydrolase
MFYNAENLFHPGSDSLNPDLEFTPFGERHWTRERYETKLNKLARVIIACGGWEAPEIVGLCEVENRRVLMDLVRDSPLKSYHYRIAHFESPDPRGIDVALIYRPEKVELLFSKPIHITPYNDTTVFSRDILHARVVLLGIDTLDIFVNHWPSRRSGEYHSRGARMKAGEAICRYAGTKNIDAISGRTLLMGDFNDEASDSAIAVLCRSYPGSLAAWPVIYDDEKVRGSLVHDPGTGPAWYQFDSFYLSPGLLNASYKPESAFRVFSLPEMLERREHSSFWVPRRTYSGYTYQAGYSDHLPVYLDLIRP